MKNKTLIPALILLSVMATGIPTSYADTGIDNVEVNPTHIGIILAIGLGGAVVTSLEGKIKSGQKFDGAKFFVAVKRTAAISIPSTFAMIAFNPNPAVMDYVIVAMAVIFGAKMMHTKKPALFQPTSEVPTQVTVSTEHTTIQQAPELGPSSSWYQTNFIEDSKKGNVLPFGADLWIKVPGARSYVSAVLKNSSGKVIQVDQSHPKDEDNNKETTRLEMKQRDGTPMPRGQYTLKIQADVGSGDGQGIKSDKFIIY